VNPKLVKTKFLTLVKKRQDRKNVELRSFENRASLLHLYERVNTIGEWVLPLLRQLPRAKRHDRVLREVRARHQDQNEAPEV